MTNEQPAPPSAPRRDRPWRVDVRWSFLAVIFIGVIGVGALAMAITASFLKAGGLRIDALISATILTAVLTMFAAASPAGKLGAKLGLRRLSLDDVKIALAGLGLVYILQISSQPVWARMLQAYGIEYQQRQALLEICSRASWSRYIGMLAVTGVMVPFLEEIVFRRLIFGLLRPLSAFAAVLVTALIFAAAHNFIYGLPSLAMLGAVFQWQYLRTGNLLTSTLTHMIYNLVSLTLVFAQGR